MSFSRFLMGSILALLVLVALFVLRQASAVLTFSGK